MTAAMPNAPPTISNTGPQMAGSSGGSGPPELFMPPGADDIGETVPPAVGAVVGTGVGTLVAVGEDGGVGLAEGVGEGAVMRIGTCARSVFVAISVALTVPRG